MTHYFHYEGTEIHNSILTIIRKTLHLTDTLCVIEADQVFISKLHVMLTQIIPKTG